MRISQGRSAEKVCIKIGVVGSAISEVFPQLRLELGPGHLRDGGRSCDQGFGMR